jgi:hypothetical protein
VNSDEARLKKVRALYRAAVDMPADRRATFLEAACGDDSGVRAEVEHLLLDESTQTESTVLQPEFDRVVTVPRNQEGSVVGDYRLTRSLGSGGMGEVWEAERIDNGRRVALKLLSSRLAGTEKGVQRFLREGRLAAGVTHPRSTFIYETGRDGARLFIAMELLPGKTLVDVVEGREPLPVERAVDLILDVVEGLAAAHRSGVVHRDVKPSNCLLDGHGRVKVGDYGLSKSFVEVGALTQVGRFMGTLAYSSPEQLRGEEADKRSDQYSLGATLFYLIAGRPPFEGDAVSIVAKIATDPAPPLDELRPDVPAGLARIVSRTLHKDPGKRFASLEALGSALAPYCTGGTIAAEPVRRLNAFVVDFVLIVAVPALLFHWLQLADEVIQELWATRLVAANALSWVIRLTPLLFVPYFAICEAVWGQSIGKRLLHLCVQEGLVERPGPWKASLRAIVFPGLPIALGLWTGSTLMAIAGCLVFAATMRPQNGYRGLHDWATSTRVVRLLGRSNMSEVGIPRAAVAPASSEPRTFGPFRETGTIARADADELIEGRDDQLNRTVWIWIRQHGQALPAERIQLSRPARLRWLQGGTRDGFRWDVFEGSSAVRLAAAAAHLSWDHGRRILCGLAEELDAALDDGTLPRTITLNHVWIDGNGAVRLVDIGPAGEEGDREPASEVQRGPEERAIDLLLSASRAMTASSQERLLRTYQLSPVRSEVRRAATASSPSARGLIFARELAHRPTNRETLRWAIDRLRDLQSGHPVLTWYHRLGALTLSVLEGAAWVTAAIWFQRLTGHLGVQPRMRMALTWAVLIVAGIAVGALTRGGPAFQLSDIVIVTMTGRPASRLRCTIRYLVAWVPVMAVLVLRPSIMDWKALGPFDVIGMFSYTLLELGAIAGCIDVCFSIWIQPDRAVQDRLVGTRLVPR